MQASSKDLDVQSLLLWLILALDPLRYMTLSMLVRAEARLWKMRRLRPFHFWCSATFFFEEANE